MKEIDIEFDGFFASVFRYFYRRRDPTPLGPNKPRFKWMPKWVEVADVCLFDTGDLWRLCQQIRDELAGE